MTDSRFKLLCAVALSATFVAGAPALAYSDKEIAAKKEQSLEISQEVVETEKKSKKEQPVVEQEPVVEVTKKKPVKEDTDLFDTPLYPKKERLVRRKTLRSILGLRPACSTEFWRKVQPLRCEQIPES